MARSLDADGLEMYEGFFTSLEPAYLDEVSSAIHAAGFDMPMLVLFARFHESFRWRRERRRSIMKRKMIEVTRRMGGPGRYAAYSADSAILRSSWSKGSHGWSTASSNSCRSLVNAT